MTGSKPKVAGIGRLGVWGKTQYFLLAFLAVLGLNWNGGLARSQVVNPLPDPNRDRFLQPLPEPKPLPTAQSTLEMPAVNLDGVVKPLGSIARQTGKKPAFVRAFPGSDGLELIAVTSEGQVVRKSIPEAKREALLQVARELRSQVTEPRKINSNSYLPPAQQLYQWLIAPVAAELQAANTDMLVFSLDAGLRSLPLAALHDGQKFLVEKYSIALIPSFSSLDSRFADIKNVRVLAAGASVFKEQVALPAVPVELKAIAKLWGGRSLLNEAFTLENLQAARASEPFGILHIATIGEFKPGNPKNSYLQLWDEKLTLDRFRQLTWNKPPLELLVLSTTRSAVGDARAEFGFAGAAVQAGIKSVVGTLWYVSDAGTLALMAEFYQHLKKAPIKAEALRQAQLAMLSGQARIKNGTLRAGGEEVRLPPEVVGNGSLNLSHPYYWAGFALFGSAW